MKPWLERLAPVVVRFRIGSFSDKSPGQFSTHINPLLIQTFILMALLCIDMTEEVCYICGKQMKAFDVIDPDTGEKVAEEIACPDEWRETHHRART